MPLCLQVETSVSTAATARMKPLGPQPVGATPSTPISNSAKPAAAPDARYPGQAKQNGVQAVPAGYSGNGKVRM